MISTPTSSVVDSPAWDVATLFPNQGHWTEEDFFLLPGNRIVELVDGQLEVLPLASVEHQMIVSELNDHFKTFVKQNKLGLVLFAPLPVRLWPGRIREPDIVYLSKDRQDEIESSRWNAADLAVEVVSENDPDRDWETKRAEYAQAGISEYWIVDPRDRTVTVLTLPEGEREYEEVGRYAEGESAASLLLDGFSVAVTDVFNPA